MNPISMKSVLNALSRQLKSISIVFYVLAIGIGMMFSYAKFARFGINIFHYSDVLDFMIIPFSDYRILIFTLLSLFIAYGSHCLDRWWQRRYPTSYSKFNFGLNDKNWFKNASRNGLFILLFLMYLLNGAVIYGNVVERQIEKQSPIEICFQDNETLSAKLIGNTKEVIFVLDENKDVKTIPIVSIRMYGTKQIL